MDIVFVMDAKHKIFLFCSLFVSLGLTSCVDLNSGSTADVDNTIVFAKGLPIPIGSTGNLELGSLIRFDISVLPESLDGDITIPPLFFNTLGITSSPFMFGKMTMGKGGMLWGKSVIVSEFLIKMKVVSTLSEDIKIKTAFFDKDDKPSTSINLEYKGIIKRGALDAPVTSDLEITVKALTDEITYEKFEIEMWIDRDLSLPFTLNKKQYLRFENVAFVLTSGFVIKK